MTNASRSKPMTSLLHSVKPTFCSSSLKMRTEEQQLGLPEVGWCAHINTRGAIARCSHLPHVHPRHPCPYRIEVLDERHFERSLLLRTHHHVERCAARLRVVDLLDAVGALERQRVVPRLHQQHRAPDGADALAEPLQLLLDIGLPDHVVAHPEERVLLPQPILLEKVAERVEQRVDRRVEEPTHEHGGLAHPLAHGQLVHLFPEGEEVLVDVAVLCDVLGELGLACDLVARDHGVDLFHRVARQLQKQLAHAGQRHAEPQVLGQRGPGGTPLLRRQHYLGPLQLSRGDIRCQGDGPVRRRCWGLL
eukprot:scaffold92704_cov59-Phaeocystis_antarctica.AAC.2